MNIEKLTMLEKLLIIRYMCEKKELIYDDIFDDPDCLENILSVVYIGSDNKIHIY